MPIDTATPSNAPDTLLGDNMSDMSNVALVRATYLAGVFKDAAAYERILREAYGREMGTVDARASNDEAPAERLVCAHCGDNERVSYNGSHELFPDARMSSCDHEWDRSVCRRCDDRLVCAHCGDDDRVSHEAMHMPGT